MRKLILFLLFVQSAFGLIIPADRTIDWTPGVYVGVIGGIPARPTIGKNAVTDYGADPTGVSDSKAAIQSALDNTTSGKYAYIPAGTYRVIGTISILNASGKTLRGAGMGLTTLKFESDGASGSLLMSGDFPDHTPTITVTSGATKGSTNLVCDITTGTAVGRLLTVSDTNRSWVQYDSGLYGAGPTDDGHDATRLLNSTHQIKAISGTTITIWPPLPFDFTNAPKVTPWTLYMTGFGVEDLTFDQTNSSAVAAVYFSQTYNCWMKGVEVRNTGSRQVWMKKCCNNEIRECYFRDTEGTGPNHEGIDLVNNACFNLIEDNVCISAGKPAVMIGDWGGGCNGNVISYNYFIAQPTNSGGLETSISANHGPHSLMNLAEGNIGQAIKSDGYYGSTSHLTSFRNYWSGNYHSGYDWRLCVQLAKWSYYCNFVGNVLGTSGIGQHYTSTNSSYSQLTNLIWQIGFPATGHSSYYLTYNGTADNPGNTNLQMFDMAVDSSLIRHGNYDYVTNTTVWDGGIADTNIPNSLYLTEKPSWWGGNPWPPIGPDLTPKVATVPAYDRHIWNLKIIE